MRALLAVAAVLLVACGNTAPVTPVGGGAGGGAFGGGSGGGTEGGGAGGGSGGGTADAGPGGGTGGDAGVGDGGIVTDPLIIARPYQTVVPSVAVPGYPVPLVVLLHGYTATAPEQSWYFQLNDVALRRGFILALPNGLVDSVGSHFWNATDACCNFFGSTVDDVAYLTAVIDDVMKRYTVDPKRVFIVGHSNGAFMAHRMACERSEKIAAIVALAGAVWSDASKCTPTSPVSVLQVHGTLDAVILYGGGTVAMPGAGPYPSASTTMQTWATKNHCTGSRGDAGVPLDLTSDLLGDETRREAYSGCPPGSAAELWTIQGGSHVPVFNNTWSPTFYDWMLAHPKP